jgi:hypothetical protein
LPGCDRTRRESGTALARLGFLSDSRFKMLVAAGAWALDARVAAFTGILLLLTTVLFGLIPSFHFRRVNLNDALKAAPRNQHSRRGGFLVSRYLTAMELAVAFTLLAGAGLLMRSFAGLLSVDHTWWITC